MGVWGWDLLEDEVVLYGYAHHTFFADDDGDWNIDVFPGLRSRALLENRHGHRNSSGFVECEVEPTFDAAGQRLQEESAYKGYFGRILYCHVIVTGTWACDRSHSWEGDSVNSIGGTSDGKTEIHPITGILVERPPTANNRMRRIDLFAFADAGHGRVTNTPLDLKGGATPPHADEDRHVNLSLPLGAGSTIQISNETNLVQSRQIGVVPGSHRLARLRATFQTGTVSDGKGFYHCSVDVSPGYTLKSFLLSRALDPSKGITKAMTRCGVKSVRALFRVARLEGHPGFYEPVACISIAGAIDAQEKLLADVNQQTTSDVDEGYKPKQSPDTGIDKSAIETQIKKLVGQWNALGCQDTDFGPGTGP